MTPKQATQLLFQAVVVTGKLSDAEAALAAGADPNARDDQLYTPLHLAARGGNTDLARLLIDKGADPNAKDDDHRTPLHLAVLSGHTDLARLLIEKGVDVNAKNRWQQTPLHGAASSGHTDAGRLLIDKGADPTARDDEQRTPRQYAVSAGYADLARLLTEKGADVQKPDSAGADFAGRLGKRPSTQTLNARDDLLAELERIEDRDTPTISGMAPNKLISVNELIGHIRNQTPIGQKMVRLHEDVLRTSREPKPGNPQGRTP
jgi:ankyrin repeat protein